MEHGYRVFDGGLGGHALYGLDNNLLCLCVGIELCLVHNLVYVRCRVGASLVLEALHEAVLSLLGAETREFLELLALLNLHLLELLLLEGYELLLVLNTLCALVALLLAAAQFFLTLVERDLTLLQAVLALLYLLVARLHLLLEFSLLVEELLLYLKELLLLYNFSLLVGGCNHFIIFSLDYIAENSIACCCANDESEHGTD